MPAALYFQIICLISLVVLILCTAYLLVLKRRYIQLAEQHRVAVDEREQLSVACKELETKIAQQDDFAEDLTRAASSHDIRLGMLNRSHDGAFRHTPERYHYVKRLVENGMDATSISELLSISVHEAEQLVSLARIAAD